jgi:hypothetical protein
MHTNKAVVFLVIGNLLGIVGTSASQKAMMQFHKHPPFKKRGKKGKIKIKIRELDSVIIV